MEPVSLGKGLRREKVRSPVAMLSPRIQSSRHEVLTLPWVGAATLLVGCAYSCSALSLFLSYLLQEGQCVLAKLGPPSLCLFICVVWSVLCKELDTCIHIGLHKWTCVFMYAHSSLHMCTHMPVLPTMNAHRHKNSLIQCVSAKHTCTHIQWAFTYLFVYVSIHPCMSTFTCINAHIHRLIKHSLTCAHPYLHTCICTLCIHIHILVYVYFHWCAYN